MDTSQKPTTPPAAPPPSEKPAVAPASPRVPAAPVVESFSSASASPAAPPLSPPPPASAYVAPHGKNNIPVIMVAVLFLLLILGGIAAFMLRPQSKPEDSVVATPTAESTQVPTEIPTPTIEPTKTPPEKEIDTIDIGTDEASFNDINRDLNKL